ncbi:efflux RND transporter periplasmic adaptor subunit [Azospirillum sp.]|uniref:efflux RND transporter periplasmic adaptor subunit n=1 Tax=Azospirillum sp. TaxID=34012 RepID=UPI003D765DA5
MRRRFVTVLALLVLVPAGTAAYAWFGATEPPPAYRFAKVERGPLVSAITATGKMTAVVTVEVSSQLSGQIAELNADFNSKVVTGQLLAQLNTAQLVARLKSAQADLDAAAAALSVSRAQRDKAQADTANARAALASAVAQIARAELAVLDADRDLVRREELRSRGVATTADFEKAQTAARSARAALTSAVAQRQQAEAGVQSAEASHAVAVAQVQVAEANVAQRQAALQLVQVDIDRSEIRSPIDGVVVDRKVNVGQTVAASLSAPTLFTIAQDLRHMQVLANIDEADIGRVREGLPVTFTLNTFPGESFHGTVSQVRLAPAEEQNVVSYIVAITVQNQDMRLLPGLTANLRIVVEERRNTVKVPNAALRFRPADAARGDAAPTPTTGGPSGGRGAAALEDLARRLAADLGLDAKQRAALDAVVVEARDRFAALGGPGDPERQRAEARAIRQRANEQIVALLAPEQREAFEELRAGQGRQGAARNVWVAGATGAPVAVAVRVGITDGSFTEVTGGLEAGQEVITGVLPPEQNAKRGLRLAF